MATGHLDIALPARIESLEVRELQAEEGATLQDLFDGLPDYATLFGDPGAADAVSTFLSLPEGKDYEDKFLFGIWDGVRLVGAGDLIRGYPAANVWTLGLFVLDMPHRGQGVGRALMGWVEGAARGQGAAWMRCLVRPQNEDGAHFLTALGYTKESELPSSNRAVYQKPLG
ncbi:GNAT family N-acetyltransferase [Streptomyces vastus]|uniref:N-acetyltransferase domain-containing protein n=1 Tax=Streptomyces vastus TaxID=285451 RepID=A0ABN3R060_9ACTN